MVNIWPFKIPVIGALAKLAGYLNINSMPFDEFQDKAQRLLDEKVSIIFFPEGTRSNSKKMGNFHSGPFRLFLESKTPIIPVCISGNEEIPPKGSIVLRNGTIRIRTLPPFYWEEYKDLTAHIIKNRVKKRMAEELAVMESGT